MAPDGVYSPQAAHPQCWCGGPGPPRGFPLLGPAAQTHCPAGWTRHSPHFIPSRIFHLQSLRHNYFKVGQNLGMRQNSAQGNQRIMQPAMPAPPPVKMEPKKPVSPLFPSLDAPSPVKPQPQIPQPMSSANTQVSSLFCARHKARDFLMRKCL
jgi:hypothetical protein